VNHVGLEFAWEIFDNEGVMGAFIDANTATDAKALRDVRLAGMLVHDDAFLPVSDRGTEDLALIVALLGLTIVFLQNRNTHSVTQPILSSFLFCFTCRSPVKTGKDSQSAVAQMRPLRCSCPRMRRMVHGVGNFMLALRSASRAVR
jgi:hypothetical protein